MQAVNADTLATTDLAGLARLGMDQMLDKVRLLVETNADHLKDSRAFFPWGSFQSATSFRSRTRQAACIRRFWATHWAQSQRAF